MHGPCCQSRDVDRKLPQATRRVNKSFTGGSCMLEGNCPGILAVAVLKANQIGRGCPKESQEDISP